MAKTEIWPKEAGRDVFPTEPCLVCKNHFVKFQMVHYVKIKRRVHYVHEKCYEKELKR